MTPKLRRVIYRVVIVRSGIISRSIAWKQDPRHAVYSVRETNQAFARVNLRKKMRQVYKHGPRKACA